MQKLKSIATSSSLKTDLTLIIFDSLQFLKMEPCSFQKMVRSLSSTMDYVKRGRIETMIFRISLSPKLCILPTLYLANA